MASTNSTNSTTSSNSTAAGLAVAIPAVLAYNIFGKIVSSCEADLEGFAHDLRETLLARQANDQA